MIYVNKHIAYIHTYTYTYIIGIYICLYGIVNIYMFTYKGYIGLCRYYVA